MTATYRHPDAIVTTRWLADHLPDPDLRIFDCTYYLHYEVGTGRPYRPESGEADYRSGHIPGSAFLDLQRDFSDNDAPTKFMRLSPQATADAFARHGLGPGNRAILYTRNGVNWATRFWWMLRWIGFDNAAVLDGGMDKWLAEDRPTATGNETYAAAQLTASERPGLWAGKSDMLGGIGNAATCSLNALTPDLHSGDNDRYGRPGRIPGSTNVPGSALLLPETKAFRPAPDVAATFAEAGATPDKRILNYCGGGIAATVDAFLQHQLGFPNIAVYDASMSEWAQDESLPIETG